VFEVKFGVDLLIEKYFYLNLIEGYKKISRQHLTAILKILI
jgi:hypothetical protein